MHRKSGPVHINIHIAEPLYEFTQKELPHTHWVDYVRTGLYGVGVALEDTVYVHEGVHHLAVLAHRPLP